MEVDQFPGGLESPPDQASKELLEKMECEAGTAMTPSDSTAGVGCFDCNICLDFSRDPVVTLCGHLYCWPCIYKWLITQQWCPVCKAPLSQAALVPLYGRGVAANVPETGIEIPHRPSATCLAHPLEATRPLALAQPPLPTDHHYSSNQVSQQYYHYHHHHYYPLYNHHPLPNFSGGSTTGHAIHQRAGGMVYALLPWVLGLVFGCSQSVLYRSDPHYLAGNDSGGSNAGRWQQERQAEMSLNRVSLFLLCCLVLCLFLF